MTNTHICDFGCGKEATYQFKGSKRWCCSPSVNSCEGKRKRDSEKKKGIDPWHGKEHPKGMLGKIPANKGKSYEELFGKEKADSIKQKMSLSMLGSTGWSKIDGETLKRIKLEASERAYRRHAEGWQGAIGRCKKIKYSSLIAGNIVVDGNWELSVAKYLDFKKLLWRRNKDRFKYFYKGKIRFYTPDFYVDEWKSYIEVKGYETDLDKAKWSYFTEKLIIWKKDKIKDIRKEMEC